MIGILIDTIFLIKPIRIIIFTRIIISIKYLLSISVNIIIQNILGFNEPTAEAYKFYK